jgi:hypothetical protein
MGVVAEKKRNREREEDKSASKLGEAKRGKERADDKAAAKELERKHASDRVDDQKLAADERLAESVRAQKAEAMSTALLNRLLNANDGLAMMATECKESREARQREAEGTALAGKKGGRARKAVGEGED